ncbi:MarR family winged helix-turn-helix transcriptional regulator [Nocardiopsis suaedae]|uniref:MarR family transcriptional regulator n=1 Tax=Nocardiopsis suaedae TaxID=3018444 RepID=A0ABT4TUH1_9ACTN|nr:MarR family transcriptional regulator [Nocardiopsis suaedae]MDA2808335.1 MarR family transcriptional regulator [Nocardiopsis suaedae]
MENETRGMGRSADGPTDDELITAWGLIHEALRDIDPRLLKGLDTSGGDMAGPWFEVLIRLQRSPQQRLPMSRLAREVSLSSGGFTKLADRMAHKGYLARESCPTDRRVVYAVLTPAGRAVADEAKARHAALLREHVLAVIGAEGVERLAGLARALRDNARAGE